MLIVGNYNVNSHENERIDMQFIGCPNFLLVVYFCLNLLFVHNSGGQMRSVANVIWHGSVYTPAATVQIHRTALAQCLTLKRNELQRATLPALRYPLSFGGSVVKKKQQHKTTTALKQVRRQNRTAELVQ